MRSPGHAEPSSTAVNADGYLMTMCDEYLRPSALLKARREKVRSVLERAGVSHPMIFGSVARGADGIASDIDLLVRFSDQHDIVDLLDLEHELEVLLGVPVHVIDARATGKVADRARAEAVPL